MNYIVISPYYPHNFQKFSIELKNQGFNVLGIGEEPYDQLDDRLKDALTEYFRVNSLDDVEEVKRAVAFLFHKHGPIDRIESQNEHWMELDAALRTQFNVYGLKERDLKKTKHKSEMKKYFEKAGVPAGECAFIGDNLTKDVKGAWDNGLKGIWYTKWIEQQEEREYPVIQSFDEVDVEEFLK